MNKPIIVLSLISFLISACGPGQILGPTMTLTPTDTSTPTPSNTPTPTPTFTLTPTPSKMPTSSPTSTQTYSPTITPTPPPGLGVKASEVVDTFSEFFTFSDIADIEGNAAQKGITDEGYSAITLVGAPYLVKAELRIDLSGEASPIATVYWILFLEITSRGGEEAAVWVHNNFYEAMVNHKVEKIFGKKKVILESNIKGSLFLLTVLPAESQ